MDTLKEAPKAIDWPRIKIGAQEFTLRFSYASNYQLAAWKKTLGSATNIELAASMAGSFDTKGKWHSAGFDNGLELADLLSELSPEDQWDTETKVLEAVTDALKKAFPGLEVVKTLNQNGDGEKTDSSISGPSPSVQVA